MSAFNYLAVTHTVSPEYPHILLRTPAWIGVVCGSVELDACNYISMVVVSLIRCLPVDDIGAHPYYPVMRKKREYPLNTV